MFLKKSIRFVIFLSIISFTIFLPKTVSADTITDYSVLATESLHIMKKAKVESGFVGGEGELIIGQKVVTEDTVRVTAPSVFLKKGAKVKGDVHYKDDLVIQKNAVVLGAQVLKDAPDDWPIVTIPSQTACSPDLNNNIVIAQTDTENLTPGAYGDIRVGRKGVLILSGGEYHLNTFHIGREAKVYFTGPASVCVAGHMMTKAKTFFGPDPENTNITGADIQIHVNGEEGHVCKEDHADDKKDKKHHDGHSVKIGKKSVFFGQVKALNGTMRIKKSVQATGHI